MERKKWFWFDRVPGYQQWNLGYITNRFMCASEFHGYWHGLGVNLKLKLWDRTYRSKDGDQGPLHTYMSGHVYFSVDTLFGGVCFMLSWASRAWLRDVLCEDGEGNYLSPSPLVETEEIPV